MKEYRHGGAREALGEDNRGRSCFVNGEPFGSIRDAANELKRLGKGVSYWMLYRALRKHKPQIADVSIALAADIRAPGQQAYSHEPGQPLISRPVTGRGE